MAWEMTAAADGGQVAIWGEGRLRVVELPRLRLRETYLSGVDADVAFVGDGLLAAIRIDDATSLWSMSAPGLDMRAQLVVPGAVRLHASTGGHALITVDGATALVRVETLAVEPIPALATARWAVVAERGTYLVGTDDGAVLWDPATATVAGRVELDLPAGVRGLGIAGQSRHLWAITGDATLHLRRLVDGRARAMPLPAPIARVWSHPQSTWLVALAGGALYRINTSLGTCERTELEPSPTQALIVEPPHVRLVQHGADGVRIVSVASTQPAPMPAPDPALATAAALPVAPPRTGPGEAPISPTGEWRLRLVAWSNATLAGVRAAMPASPLDALSQRLGLPPAARHLLGLIYGRWMAGEGREGVPAAVAAVCLAADHEPDPWPEVLAAGTLGGLGLITCRGGRVRASAGLADHLDGRPPQCVTWAPGRSTATPRGGYALVVDDPAAAAPRLAAELGAALHVIGPLARARAEAALLGLPLVTLRSDELPLAGVTLLETVIVVVGPGEELGLPRWNGEVLGKMRTGDVVPDAGAIP